MTAQFKPGHFLRGILYQLRTLPERKAKRTRSAFYALGGAALGFLILHPFSMIVFKASAQTFGDSSRRALISSFATSMWPMWLWYCLLGAILGWFVALLVNRNRIIEGIIPICSWCGKIRVKDKEGSEEATWQRLDKFLEEKGVKESGAICSECLPAFIIKLKLRTSSVCKSRHWDAN